MEKTIFTLKKIIILCVNYQTLHVRQPDVASGVRPETKPLIVTTGFHMYYCRWQAAISALRFSEFTRVQLRFSFSFLLFFWLFLLRMRGNLLIYQKCPFLVFFGAIDGNFIEKYSVMPSWQRTCLWQMTGVRIVSCRSADFNLFQMTYKYISASSEDFGSLKFSWKKVQHSESGWYAHDLRYMFVVMSSGPPRSLINFFLKDDNQRRDFSSGYCS